MTRSLQVEWLGRMPYAEALALQEARVAEVRAGRAGDALLLLEHPPVITLGRSARPENLLQSPDALAERGVELHEIARGGDITWHGPGQLVGYAILDLQARGRADVHRFLRDLESGLIDTLEKLGLAAEIRSGMTGVFVAPSAPPRKIASIGVGLRGWVTWHGFALNVDPDLAGFDAIVPCGLQGVEMTSIARELGEAAPADLLARSREAVADAFVRRFA
ncbi:MAG: lipoyl(octanoyl) transferase LipB [Deltaproteobacteria bacterium]|nr:lipoyl(octanoyl) transferase LipB [Deltaproteobacteria bacterium]MBW2371725.1 lipoyl(octanoyl) transferase LipB [Deltaproteobacteria bacterium]